MIECGIDFLKGALKISKNCLYIQKNNKNSIVLLVCNLIDNLSADIVDKVHGCKWKTILLLFGVFRQMIKLARLYR